MDFTEDDVRKLPWRLGRGRGQEVREGSGPGTHGTAGVMQEDPNQMEATGSRDCAREARSLVEGKDTGNKNGLALQILGGGDAERRGGRGGGYQRVS